MEESVEQRLRAKKQIREFFDARRSALNVGPLTDFSFENQLKRRFLAELNSMAKEFEFRAEKESDVSKLLEKAGRAVEKLKKAYIDEIKSRPVGESVYKKLISEIQGI